MASTAPAMANAAPEPGLIAAGERLSSLFLCFDPAGKITSPFVHARGIECRRAMPNHGEENAVSDESEDFAAMFEASVQAKRLEQGELVEGRIVAIGPEVAL